MARYSTEYERAKDRNIRGYNGEVHVLRTLKLGGDGREIHFRDAHKQAKTNLHGFMRWMSRAGKLALADYEQEELRWLVDDLTQYAHIWEEQIEDLKKRKAKQEKVDALRNVAGREPEEAATYLAKADELERGQ